MQTVPVANGHKALPAEQRLTLNNVPWEAYEKLLDAFGEHRSVRFHYGQGALELTVPLVRVKGGIDA